MSDKHILSIASLEGDTLLAFDPAVEDEVKEAQKAFDTAKSQGMLAYTEEKPGEGQVVSTFDPDAKATYMSPQLVGG